MNKEQKNAYSKLYMQKYRQLQKDNLVMLEKKRAGLEEEIEINNLKELSEYVTKRGLSVINRVGHIVFLDNKTTLIINFDELGKTI